MRKRAQNSNKQFLIGTAAMAFAVMAVVIIFINLCLPYIKPGMEKKQIADLYQIEFSKGFAGDSAMVYLNDSLVWCDLVPADTTTLRIHRFADENTLMVSRSANDAVSIFNITQKAGRLILRKNKNMVSMTTLDW